MVKSHMIISLTSAPFDQVIKVLWGLQEAVSVHAEIINSKPRVAIFIGEKYFFRTDSWASSVTIVKETARGTLVKIIATAGGEGILNFGWGANRSYAHEIFDYIMRSCGAEIVKEVDNYDISKLRESVVEDELPK